MGKAARLLSLAALAATNAISCVSAELRSPAQGGAQWTQVETANFRLFSDSPPVETELIAKQLETDLSAVSQAAFKSANPIVEKTDVILFSQSAHFHHFAPGSVGGFFFRGLPLSSETRHTVVTYGQLDEDTRTTLLHELTHDLFARNFGPAPAWLNEGWAQYYSTVRVENGKLRVGSALPSLTFTDEARPFAAMNNGQQFLAMPVSKVIPPSALTAMSGEEFYGFSDRTEPTFDELIEDSARYLGAWGFLHMLVDSKNHYSHRFDAFLHRVRTTSVEDAWTRAFQGVDPNQLDRDFRTYLFERQLAVFTVPFTNRPDTRVLSKGTLSDGEVHALWARLHLASLSNGPDALSGAQVELDAALKSDPHLADAFYYRGLLALRGRHFDQAAVHFDQATRLAPLEPRFLFARIKLEFTRRGGNMSPTEALRLRPSVEELARLAESAPSLLLAAHYFLAAGEEDRALVLGRRALNLSPVDPAILHSYALLLEGADRIGDALIHQRLALAFLTEDQGARAELQSDLRRMEARSPPNVLPSASIRSVDQPAQTVP